MKNLHFFLAIATIVSQFSCRSDEKKKNSTKDIAIQTASPDSIPDRTFNTDWKTLTKDFNTWYSYTYKNIKLSQDFIGLDADSTKIDKATLLNKLMTGNVVVYKTQIFKGQSVYQLFKLNTNDQGIKSAIRQIASTEMAHLKMEGTQIPEFDFTDIRGKVYNKSSTQGKIVVFKCWFIRCVACVKEFPELNRLVNQYRERKDVLFVSLALDPKEDLLKFLEARELKYATVPDMENYISTKLSINEYPTHLLIDGSGKIIKVVNNIDELEPFLAKQSAKNAL